MLACKMRDANLYRTAKQTFNLHRANNRAGSPLNPCFSHMIPVSIHRHRPSGKTHLLGLNTYVYYYFSLFILMSDHSHRIFSFFVDRRKIIVIGILFLGLVVDHGHLDLRYGKQLIVRIC